MPKLLSFNKPFRVLSQFSDEGDKVGLARYVNVPNVYAAGRLDFDSEGLLLLTDDGTLQHRLSHPKFRTRKHYWAQVEGEPAVADLARLRQGIELRDGIAQALVAEPIQEPELWFRDPPIRERLNIPTSWLNLVICEGRNRQVRRMTAHIGFPTLRLIRHRIGDYSLNTLCPGELREETSPVLARKR